MPPESVQLLGAYQKRSFLNCEKQKRKSCLSVQLTLLVVPSGDFEPWRNAMRFPCMAFLMGVWVALAHIAARELGA